MKLLELVPCCRKGVFPVDQDAVDCHFPAKETSSLYQNHRLSDDSGITPPIHEEQHSGKTTYSSAPCIPESEGECPSQNRRRTSRSNGRNSLFNSPECRRLISSSKQWKPSLDVISEDRVVCVSKDEERTVRSAKKTTRKPGSTAKIRVYAFRDDLRQGAAPVVIPAFTPMAFLF